MNYLNLNQILEVENHVFTEDILSPLDSIYPNSSSWINFNSFNQYEDYITINKVNSLIRNDNYIELLDYIQLLKPMNKHFNSSKLSPSLILKRFIFLSSLHTEGKLNLSSLIKDIQEEIKRLQAFDNTDLLKVILHQSFYIPKTFIKEKLKYYGSLLKQLLIDSYTHNKNEYELELEGYTFSNISLNYYSINNIEMEIVYYLALFTQQLERSFEEIASDESLSYTKINKIDSDALVNDYITNATKDKIRFPYNNTSSDELSYKKRTLIKLDSLKNLNFKFIKRENIDKKIIRRFKKTLSKSLRFRSDYKKSAFLKDFLDGYYFPPFIHNELKFKSFNTSYLIWLFSHAEIEDFFEDFISNNLENITKELTDAFRVNDTEEIFTLQTYLISMSKLYSDVMVGQTTSEEKSKTTGKSERSLSLSSRRSLMSNHSLVSFNQ